MYTYLIIMYSEWGVKWEAYVLEDRAETRARGSVGQARRTTWTVWKRWTGGKDALSGLWKS